MSGARLAPEPAETPAEEKPKGGMLARMFKDPQMRKMLGGAAGGDVAGILFGLW